MAKGRIDTGRKTGVAVPVDPISGERKYQRTATLPESKTVEREADEQARSLADHVAEMHRPYRLSDPVAPLEPSRLDEWHDLMHQRDTVGHTHG